MFANTNNTFPEDRINFKNFNANWKNGVNEIFDTVSTLSSAAHASTITHSLTDEENPELDEVYTPEYNRLVELFGGHNFNRQSYLKY